MHSTHRSISLPPLRACLAAVLLALAGGCAPSIDPALKRSVDGDLAGVVATDRVYGPPSSAEPMPLAAGQWTRHRAIDEDGNPSILTYKVLAREGSAWRIEMVHRSYHATQVMRLLLEIPDRTDASQVRVRVVEMRTDDGAVTRIDESNPAMRFMNSMWDPVTASLQLDWEGSGQEDAVAPAGTFQQAYATTSTVSFGPVSATTRNLSHPAVPISGLVRAEEVGGGSSQQLLDFGTDGAESEL